MNFRVGAASLLAPLILAAAPAAAEELPAIKASAGNPVPACATPGRLNAFLKARNPKLADKFDTIAVDYMKHGEALGLRWDIAFFQMLVETGSLTFHGDVDIKQNNFAGLGATGRGESGESFKDVSTGARAHLEHILMYSGEKVENPVAERTRKVQEWGVLTSWQKTIKGPMTYKQLAAQWAPKSRKYAHDIENVADSFYDGLCKEADPRPELVAMARGGNPAGGTETVAAAPKATAADSAAGDKVSGAEIARRNIAEARAEGASRTSLGATSLAKAGADAAKPADEVKQAPAAFKLLNPTKPEGETATATPPAAAIAADPKKAAETPAIAAGGKGAAVQTASAAQTAKSLATAPAAVTKSKCNVYTASYGGQKAIIIKASAPDAVNYTVLDVNEGAEKREADAYIEAYAKGGETVGEYDSSDKALNKAFELCPEG